MKRDMKKKILAVISALVCCAGTTAIPKTIMISTAETVFADREQVYDSSLVLGEELGSILKAVSGYLYQNSMIGYATTTENCQKIEVVCAANEDIDRVKEFVADSGFNSDLLVYTIDEYFDMTLTDGEISAPVTNDELETLVTTKQYLNAYLYEKGYSDYSAYAALYWGKHSIQCYVETYQVHDDVIQFMQDNSIAETLVDVIVSPEYDFRVGDGGQRSYDEINTIVADEYISLKSYLKNTGIFSNIYLTTKQDEVHSDVFYTCVEIYVKTQADADALKDYMTKNYYWQDAVEVTVQPDLSNNPDSTIRNKEFICLEGDSNDDGMFGVADVIKLQKYLLTADTMYERQGYACDLNGDSTVDVFDLCLFKRKLINAE